MAREDPAMVDALSDAVAGAVMLVMGGAATSAFGFFKQRITTVIGVKVDGGPAESLINEVTRQYRTLSSPGVRKVGMIDRSWGEERLTEAGNRLLSATLPLMEPVVLAPPPCANAWVDASRATSTAATRWNHRRFMNSPS